MRVLSACPVVHKSPTSFWVMCASTANMRVLSACPVVHESPFQHTISKSTPAWSNMWPVGTCVMHCCRYLFSQNGIRGCNYNMNKAGVYTITFSVTNSQGLSASVNRTLAVQPVCPSGETLCSNQVRCHCSCCITLSRCQLQTYIVCLSSSHLDNDLPQV